MKNNAAPQVSLNRGQKRAKLHTMRGKYVFVDGGAGTGKSVFIRDVVKELEATGKRVLLCAPTGVAALNIGGTTIHGAFGFAAGPCIEKGKDGIARIISKVSEKLRVADIVIVDEISMIRADLFDSIVESIRKAEKATGKTIQLIVVGDFYQLPPVLRSDSIEENLLREYYGPNIGYGYAFQGKCWDECGFYMVSLTEPMRQKDPRFIACLNKIRVGDCSDLDWLNDTAMLNQGMAAVSLYSHKKDVDELNRQRLDELDGRLVTYQTMVSYEKGYNPKNVDSQLLKVFRPELKLKEGAQVIFTSNDYRTKGSSAYVNGLTGTVYSISDSGNPSEPMPIRVRTAKGDLIVVDPITVPIYDYVAQDEQLLKVKVASCIQLPIELAYALTIHRAQGQTYFYTRVCPNTFAPGQLYVGLSRSPTIESMALTRRIMPSDIIVSGAVKEFYRRMDDDLKVKKMGRPPKNQDGTLRDKLLWVPDSLSEYVQGVVTANSFHALESCPPYTKERHHVRVPESIYDSLYEEIKLWKSKARGQ